MQRLAARLDRLSPTHGPIGAPPGTCADRVYSGVSYQSGAQAPCSAVGAYCSGYSFSATIGSNCPALCGTCPSPPHDATAAAIPVGSGLEG